MKVTFHIDRLTVDGASRAEGVRVGDALRIRLAELAGTALPARASTTGRLDAGTLPPRATAEQTGHHLAKRIVRNLRGVRHG